MYTIPRGNDAARSLSRMKFPHTITALWSAWRSSSTLRDPERAHEMRHVEPLGAPGTRALLLGEPDFFLDEDLDELIEGRDPAAAGVERHR